MMSVPSLPAIVAGDRPKADFIKLNLGFSDVPLITPQLVMIGIFYFTCTWK